MIKILLALAGVTGVGKSYYKDKITEKLGFEKIKIITTREPRLGEKNGEDKVFATNEELKNLEDLGKIAYKFDLLGNTYAYTKEALFDDKNTVFELHYTEIKNFKEICPNLCSIYLLPKDIEVAKAKLRERKLRKAVENQRLLEIDEHYKKITTDKNLIKMFEYVMYNNYDEESENNIINLVKKIMEENR